MSRGLESGRPLYAVIDRSAYQHNLAVIEKHCSPAGLLAVIKADGYGHGMVQMARAAGARSLAVATPEEASRLIDEGIENTIWVLEGPFCPACLALSSRHSNIVWVVHQLAQLEMMAKQPESNYKVWLKLDTGMHRLGFLPQQVPAALAFIAKAKNLSLEGTMTHFADSDELNSESAGKQVTCFDELLQSNGLTNVPQSLANSGAVINLPQTYRSVVRPGIASYGAMSAESFNLKPVMSLRSAVMALRDVPVGESVGYGGTWTAERPSLIATIAGGYGDGYPRHAKNGTAVLVNGNRVPLAGRVSMDMLTVDVTELSAVQVGDPVELWGSELPIEDIAACAETISYELLTGVTARVPRYYL